MPRAHLRKSKNGCTQCKRRRVKCDERKPSCVNCDRNDLPCSLEFLTPMIRKHSSSSQTSGRTWSTAAQLIFASMPLELPTSSFDARTNELLHHYTRTLYKTLAGNRKRSVWRVNMPRIGLAHPFLLSGILALSALHLSTLIPHRRLELQDYAVAQESTALPLFRKALSNLDSENIHAAFGFAGAVVYYVTASSAMMHADRCRLPSRDDDQPHWFQTMRGLLAFLVSNWQELAKGPLAAFLEEDPRPLHSWYNPDDGQLAKLEEMFLLSSRLELSATPVMYSLASPNSTCSPTASDSSDLGEGHKIKTCKDALDQLREVSAVPRSPNRGRTLGYEHAARIWAGIVSQDFVDLIYEHDEMALIILAHYCVLLKQTDHVWYLRGIGKGLLENIRQTLSEDNRHWIQWAIEQPISSAGSSDCR